MIRDAASPSGTPVTDRWQNANEATPVLQGPEESGRRNSDPSLINRIIRIALGALTLAATIYTLTRLGGGNPWVVIGMTGLIGLELTVFSNLILPPEVDAVLHMASTLLAYAVFVVFWEIYQPTKETTKWLMLAPISVFFACFFRNRYEAFKEVFKSLANSDFMMQGNMEGVAEDLRDRPYFPWYHLRTTQHAPYCLFQLGVAAIGGFMALVSKRIPSPLNELVQNSGFLISGSGAGAFLSKILSEIKLSAENQNSLGWASRNFHRLTVGCKVRSLGFFQAILTQILVPLGALLAAYAIGIKMPLLTVVGLFYGAEGQIIARNLEGHRIVELNDVKSERQKTVANWIGRVALAIFLVGFAIYGAAVNIFLQPSLYYIFASINTWGSFGVSYSLAKAIEHAWDPEVAGPFLNWLNLAINENPTWVALAAAVVNHAAGQPGMPLAAYFGQLGILLAAFCLGIDIARINNFKRMRWNKADHSAIAVIAYFRAIFIIWLVKNVLM